MTYSKEQILAVILYNIAAADGQISEAEKDKIRELAANLKDFDTEGVREAFQDQAIVSLPIGAIIESLNPDDKSKYIYACCNVVTADGLITYRELICLHQIASLLDIPPYMVTYYVGKLVQEYPEISFED